MLEFTESGWKKNNETPEMFIPYYNIRNVITYTERILLKDQHLIIWSKIGEDTLVSCSGFGAYRKRLKDINKDI